jgi:hypothetical protein
MNESTGSRGGSSHAGSTNSIAINLASLRDELKSTAGQDLLKKLKNDVVRSYLNRDAQEKNGTDQFSLYRSFIEPAFKMAENAIQDGKGSAKKQQRRKTTKNQRNQERLFNADNVNLPEQMLRACGFLPRETTCDGWYDSPPLAKGPGGGRPAPAFIPTTSRAIRTFPTSTETTPRPAPDPSTKAKSPCASATSRDASPTLMFASPPRPSSSDG